MYVILKLYFFNNKYIQPTSNERLDKMYVWQLFHVDKKT